MRWPKEGDFWSGDYRVIYNGTEIGNNPESNFSKELTSTFQTVMLRCKTFNYNKNFNVYLSMC